MSVCLGALSTAAVLNTVSALLQMKVYLYSSSSHVLSAKRMNLTGWLCASSLFYSSFFLFFLLYSPVADIMHTPPLCRRLFISSTPQHCFPGWHICSLSFTDCSFTKQLVCAYLQSAYVHSVASNRKSILKSPHSRFFQRRTTNDINK